VKNPASSRRAQLLAWSRDRGIPFQYASMLYMQEGILSRIADTTFSETFILKGGFLLFSLSGRAGRTTRDLDLLGRGISNDQKYLEAAFASILGVDQEDGLVFDTDSIQSEPITEGAEYHGVRLTAVGTMGTIRNKLQIDIGFGDALSRSPVRMPIQRILGTRRFEVSTYPLASVVAEKFEIMIALGSVNSRMKDLFDIAFILDRYDISDSELKDAISTTFLQRTTALPDNPIVFSETYEASPKVQTFWTGFLRRTQLGDISLDAVLHTIRRRLAPIYEEIRNGKKSGGG